MTFEMWSIGHYLFMVSPFILTILLYLLTKKASFKTKQRLGIILSVLAVILLILRNIEIYVTHGRVFEYELLPLQICHFANFVLLYAFMTDSKAFFGLATLFNLPAALMSIIFANSLENYSNILTFRGVAYIAGHILIVVITLWAFLSGFVRLNKQTLKQTLLIVMVLYMLGLIINNVMLLTTGVASNYFYATRPESGTPLEIFFNLGKEYHIAGYFIVNPIYLILTALLGFAIISILYVLLKLVEPKNNNNQEQKTKKSAGYRSLIKE